jgi:hypothetical protein
MKTTTISQDAENFLAALLWAYPEDDDGKNPMDEKTPGDFSPEFITAVSNFCESFRAYLAAREIEIPDSPNSFGGNVYFSLSGHGCGFWDSDETAHLQSHLEAFSGSKYRFEEIDLSEDENGKLDLSYLPEFIAGYRAKMFTPAN